MKPKTTAILVTGVVAAIVVIAIVLSGFHGVDEGHVGVEKNKGAATGQTYSNSRQ